MPDVLQTLIPYVVVGMLLVAGVLFVFALWNFRRGKREPYWRLRRAASLHGWELFLVSVTLTFLASGVCLFSGLAQAVLGSSTPIPGSTATASEVRDIAATPSARATAPLDRPAGTPSGVPQATPGASTSTPTAGSALHNDASSPTPSARPTLMPYPVLPGVAITPIESSVTPPADATLTITAVDSQTTGDLQPVEPKDVLPAGARRVYFWLSYSGMADGTAWQRLLLREGNAIQGGAYLWASGTDGSAVYFFGDAEGFAPGNYEIRIELGAEEAASYSFRIE